MRIVDSHVHFWDPGRLRYAWLDGCEAIRRPFLPEDFSAAAAGLGVEQMVFVQADCAPEEGLEEVDWVAERALGDGRIAGVVAFAPLERGAEAEPWLEELARRPLVCGVRRLLQGEGPGFADAAGFRRGVSLLAGRGWPFDLCLRHPQLREAARLVEACPGVRFVLDHFGKPDIRGGELEPWREDLRALAGAGQVVCKLSGLVTEADLENWTPADLQPYIEVVADVFGPDRMLFGSDWPVCTLASTYRRWVETARASLRGWGEEELDRVFRRNAQGVYRLPESAGGAAA